VSRAAARLIPIVVLGALIHPSPVAAEDEGIPRIILKGPGARQRGLITTVTESSEDDGGCVTGHGDGTGAFPPPVGMIPGPLEVRIEIRRSDRPDAVRIRSWTEVDDSSGVERPVGTGEQVAYRLRTRRRHGEPVARIAVIRPTLETHLYLSLGLRWKGECGGDSGTWHFHLQAASTPGSGPRA
jgi:hypothetical protein